MSKTLLAAIAAVTFLSSAMLASPAAAMPLAAPASFGAANAPAPGVKRVTNVCGLSGCAPVWTKRVRKPPVGFVRRAAPLVFPMATATQNLPASK